MNFLELAKKRYSVRSYTNEKVTGDNLELILEAGRVAPTGKNTQTQQLFVVQSDEALAKVKKAARIYDAPVAIVVCAETEKAWIRPYDGKNIADIDASIVTAHMMLQATELGLGSLWVCWFDPAVIRKEFALPDNLEPVNILLVGHANEEKPTPAMSPDRHNKLRKPLSDTVTHM